jgi:hypothetical protein
MNYPIFSWIETRTCRHKIRLCCHFEPLKIDVVFLEMLRNAGAKVDVQMFSQLVPGAMDGFSAILPSGPELKGVLGGGFAHVIIPKGERADRQREEMEGLLLKWASTFRTR